MHARSGNLNLRHRLYCGINFGSTYSHQCSVIVGSVSRVCNCKSQSDIRRNKVSFNHRYFSSACYLACGLILFNKYSKPSFSQ